MTTTMEKGSATLAEIDVAAPPPVACPSPDADPAAYESIRDAFLEVDAHWEITYWNAEAEALLGIARSEVLGRSLWAVFPSAVGSKFDAHYREAVRSGEPVAFEAFFAATHAHFDVRAYPSARGLRVFFRDVTRERERDAALRQSHAAFDALLNSIPAPAWLKDAEGRYLAANRAYVDTCGRPLAEVLSHTDAEIWPPERAAHYRITDAEVHAKGAAVHVEERAIQPDGSERWFETTKVPYWGDAGEVLGTVGVSHDITARRATLLALQESETRFRTVQEGSGDGFMLFQSVRDTDGSIVDFEYVYANTSAGKIVGRAPEQLPGRRLLVDLPGHRASHLFDAYVAVVEQGEPFRNELRYSADGIDSWFRTTAVRVGDGFGVTFADISDRVRIEAEARRRGAVIEQSYDAVIISDEHGKITYWKPGAEALYGFAAEVALGADVHGLLRTRMPDGADLAIVDAQLWEHGHWDGLLLQTTRDGRELIVESRQVLIAGEAGRTEVLETSRDVTERHRAQEELRASEERFRTLSDFIPQLVWSTRPDGYHDYSNQQWYDYTGMPREQEQGGNWKLFLHPDDYDRAMKVWSHSLETGDSYEVECRFKCAATGEYRWFFDRARPMKDPDGRILRWFGTCTDVHDERMAKQALADSEARYLAVAKATNDVIWDLNLKHEGAWWSDALRISLGIEPSKIQCVEDWRALIHPDDQERVVTGFMEAIDSADGVWAAEYRLLCGDGRVATVLDRGSVLRDRDGTPARMIGSIVDLSERKRLEEELQQAQKMEAIGRLAGGVAHDFNNMLTVISAYAQMMKAEIHAGDPMREDVEQVIKAADRATGLTRQLLAFSRRQPLQPRRVDVNDIVADIEKMLGRLIGEDIELTVALADTPAFVMADVGQVEQVLLNLAVNARDALHPGGRISVTVGSALRPPAHAPGTAATKHVRVSVADNGSGIPADVLPRIFEPFFTTKPAGAGTGLGLATVYGIVKQSGGHLEVDTEPGQGTEFRVLLPCDDEVGPSPFTRPSGPQRLTAGHETVLLVEDEPAVRGAARRMLKRNGYTVHEARDGVEALEVFERHGRAIDLIVADLVMPRMGGRELIDRVKEMGTPVRALFMSGYSDDEGYRRSSFPTGIAFLEKPFTIQALVERVRQVLDAPRQAMEGDALQ